jgi:hypothetical protein
MVHTSHKSLSFCTFCMTSIPKLENTVFWKPNLLGPFERADFNYWKTDPVSKMPCFLDFRMLDDGQSPEARWFWIKNWYHSCTSQHSWERTNLYTISRSELPNPSISTTTDRYHHSKHEIELGFWKVKCSNPPSIPYNFKTLSITTKAASVA